MKATIVSDGYQEQMILVKGGYTPDTIRIVAGRPVRLLFRREETAACSEQVLLPDFGKSAGLPTGRVVPVEFMPAEPGSHEFTCSDGHAPRADRGGSRPMNGPTLIDSRQAPAATCLVCGNGIPAGEGVTARYGDRTLRFKCPGCYARFQGDPEPYLAGARPVAAATGCSRAGKRSALQPRAGT